MKFEVPIKVDIDDVTKLIHDLQCLQTYKLGVNDTMVLVSLDDVAEVFADHIRAKRLDKDIDAPSKSALDHIHNVVAENAYKRGYEQGKADASPKWIPLKAHPATEEERESRPDIDYWFDCEMPDDEQEILVTVKHKNWTGVEKDVCYVEDSYGLDSGHGWLDDVVAWMPLPEPYKEGEWKC